MTVFTLSGTPPQQALVQSAIDACDFPFDRLIEKLQATKGRTTIPVEWADLSAYGAQVAQAKPTGRHAHIHEGGDTGHPIEYRERVLGLAWYSGKVSLDLSLEQNPPLAHEVFLAEGAHMVDFFYMTDDDRATITSLLHGGDTTEHGHGWFDQGTYVEWVGEAFMGLFIKSFAPAVSVTLTQFVHQATPEVAAATRRLLLRELEPPADPLAGFPFAELDEWAAKRRPWWPRYARSAADAYVAWR